MCLRSNLKSLPREVLFLCIATFVSRAGTMALAFLAVYLSSWGISEGRAGFAVSIYGLGGLIAAPIAGYFCDRLSALFIMKLALFLQGFILLMFPMVGGFKSFLCITLVWALAAESFRPASSAFIGSLTDEKLRSVSFALNRVAVNAGMAIGPALGGILIHLRPSYIFVANSGASILAGALLTCSLWGKSFDPMPAEGGPVGHRDDGRFGLGVGSLLLFLLTLIPAFVVFYQYRSTMPQYFLDRQILEPYVFGLLLPINALLVITLQAPLTLYLQRWPQNLNMSLGAFLIGTGFGCFVFATTFFGAASCVVVWTFGEMALLSSSEVYVARIAGGKKGQYMGLYHMAINFAAFIGPGLGSVALGHSAVTLWGATFICGSTSAILLLHMTKQAKAIHRAHDLTITPSRVQFLAPEYDLSNIGS